MGNQFFLFFCFFIFSAQSFGSQVYNLDWNDPREVLEYHSCGCADSCWIAELKDKKKKSLKIRLRCDCERLYVAYKSLKKERVYKTNCDVFEAKQANAKSKAIIQEMRKLQGKSSK